MAVLPTYTVVSAPVTPTYNTLPYPTGYAFNESSIIFDSTVVTFNGNNIE